MLSHTNVAAVGKNYKQILNGEKIIIFHICLPRLRLLFYFIYGFWYFIIDLSNIWQYVWACEKLSSYWEKGKCWSIDNVNSVLIVRLRESYWGLKGLFCFCLRNFRQQGLGRIWVASMQWSTGSPHFNINS